MSFSRRLQSALSCTDLPAIVCHKSPASSGFFEFQLSCGTLMATILRRWPVCRQRTSCAYSRSAGKRLEPNPCTAVVQAADVPGGAQAASAMAARLGLAPGAPLPPDALELLQRQHAQHMAAVNGGAAPQVRTSNCSTQHGVRSSSSMCCRLLCMSCVRWNGTCATMLWQQPMPW